MNHLRLSLALGAPNDIGEEPGHVNGLEVQAQLAGFDAREIEELVNGLGQLLDADQRGRHQFALARRQEVGRFLEHQQRHPQRCQRRLQLM